MDILFLTSPALALILQLKIIWKNKKHNILILSEPIMPKK